MNELRPNLSPKALWIGTEHPFDQQEAYLCFRSPVEWTLDRKPKRAELLISADSRYKLWVNGQFVARGPTRSYPRKQSVDRLDVAPDLQAGVNTVAVCVYQPGYSHFAYVYRGATGLLIDLSCDGESVLVSDGRWHARRDPSFSGRVPRVSIYSTGVEERDLNLSGDWIATGHDDSDWANVRVVAQQSSYPWTELQLRELPLLTEREIPTTLLETRVGKSAVEDDDAHLALRTGWSEAAAHPPPDDDEGWLRPGLDAKESAYWLFDLGRDYTCQARVEIEQAGGQERLSVSYAEKIRDGQIVISDPQTYCRMRLTDRFRLRPGNQTAETFTLRGGRYLIVQLDGPTGTDFRLRPHVWVSEYPLEISRELKVSDPLLTQIVKLCEETFHAGLQDGFVDGNWRESSQWLGDALPQSVVLSSISDDTRPIRQVIEMAAQGAYPDGVLPSVNPGEVHAYAIVDYNFSWVELLTHYDEVCADEELVKSMWPTLVKMLDRFHRDLDGEGLLISQPGRRLFLDWAPLSRGEPSAVYNLRYLYALQKASRLANSRGHQSDANRWQSRAEALSAKIYTSFWHEGRWYDDLERSTFSQLAAALAILTDCTRAEEQSALLDAIAARSLDLDDSAKPNAMVLASPFMHHYLFEALRHSGRGDQVVEIIRGRWGRWVLKGYPTAWENWNVDFPDGSQCHAYSAHPRYHLAEIEKGRR